VAFLIKITVEKLALENKGKVKRDLILADKIIPYKSMGYQF
jgi:hypothetical protein